MYPVIILDGPDCSGKTTLAKAICKQYGAAYIHATYRWKGKMDVYHTAIALKALKLSQTQPVVIDRWWMSEIAYGNVYRDGPEKPGYELCLDYMARTYGWTYVMCLPAFEEYRDFYLKQRMNVKDDEFEGNIDNACKIWHEYRKIKASLKERKDVIQYNMNRATPNGYSHAIMSTALFRLNSQYQPLIDPNQRWISGHTSDAKVILVGDKPNSKGRRHFWPFFESANCSIWLMRKLMGIGHEKYVDPTKIMLANAYIDDEPNPLLREVVDYSNIVVVPMGDVARNFLDSKDIKYEFYMSHPQYYRRFRPEAGIAAFSVMKELML